MNKDIKAIVESYTKLGINHTERSSGSYMYAPKEYPEARSENEEVGAIQKEISTDLSTLAKKASRGLKEDYLYIASSLKKTLEDVTSIIGKL